MITILLADDHPFFIDGVRCLVQETDDMAVAGEVSGGAHALHFIREHKPAIAVLDISMPDMTGIAVAQRILAERIETRIIILSVHEDQGYIRQAIEAGVRGYVLKRSAAQNLLFAIRAVSSGGFYLDPVIAGRMMPTTPKRAQSADTMQVSSLPPPLTNRETEVLKQFAHGYTIKEVAARLGITIKSVETYKSRASEKLQLGSRAKIVQFAVRQGWFQDAHG